MNQAAVVESPDALTCSACEYDLRGLDPGGACPECGQAIEQSRRVQRDRPKQLRLLSFGSLLIGLAMVIGGFGAALDARGRSDDSIRWFPTAALIGGVGTWFFASTSRSRERRLAGFVRIAAVVTPTVQCMIWIASQSGLLRGPTELIERMLQLMTVIWAIAAAATLTRAAILAREVNDVMGKVQARLLSVLSPALLVLIALCAGRILSGPAVMPLLIGLIIAIFAITGWAAIFFLGFSVVLFKAARRVECELKEPS